jgi:ComF family protein
MCTHCSAWPVEVGEVRAAYAFGGPIRDSIHRYKYQGEFARAPSLAALVFQAMQRPEFETSSAWDLVAFVPLHSRRRRQRGFDQAMLLARNLSELLELPYTSELKRLIDTPTQVGRGSAERQTNVRDAFGWSGGQLAGARILMVDDVITTGATFVSASRALIRAGAQRVDGIAIAREIFH